MFSQVIGNLRKATDATLQVQQEVFNTWTGMCPLVPPLAAGWGVSIRQAQEGWAEILGDLVQSQHELLQVQFGAGLQSAADVFQLVRAKDPEELHARAIDFWQKTCDRIRQVYEAQVRDFQAVVAKGTGMITQGTAEARSTAPGHRESLGQPSAVPGLTHRELEEVRDTLYEHELTKGDWSKAR
jgi:hypothetical protein